MKSAAIDQYIANAEPFARPVLMHVRALIHAAHPEVTEKIKWNCPSFEVNGSFCYMASFKKHLGVGFHHYELLKDANKILQPNKAHGGGAMGNLGKLTKLEDLPSDRSFIALVKEAVQLNLDGKVKKTVSKEVAVLIVPEFIERELKANKVANSFFNTLSVSCKREYVNWVSEAKTETTREKRLNTMIDWLTAGKKLHWKYEKK